MNASFDLHFLNAETPIDRHLNRLPHWQQEGTLQFVTWTLGDALPAVKREQLVQERQEWLRMNPEPWTVAQEKTFYHLFSDRVQEWLDAGAGKCVLK